MDGAELARRWAAGETQVALAREVGVSRQRVSQLMERAMGRDWMRAQRKRRGHVDVVAVEAPPSSAPRRECVVCVGPVWSRSVVPLCASHRRWYSQVRRLVIPGVRDAHNALMRGRRDAERPRRYRPLSGSAMDRLIGESREKGGLLARIIDGI